MSIKGHYTAAQSKVNLQFSASLANTTGQPASKAVLPLQRPITLTERSACINPAKLASPATSGCEQTITVSLFFDGTGNNLDADITTYELSNVAKLYLAHIESDSTQGLHRLYIPGIGTYFEEIGDPGGTPEGMGFGAWGQHRIDWAISQFDKIISEAAAIAMNPRNKVNSINVAAFGFSRGATLARAFARELQKKCSKTSEGWKLIKYQYPMNFYFLGLWDTVASVGLPLSGNTTSNAQAFKIVDTSIAMKQRNQGNNGVKSLAFKPYGADPAPGPYDGHSTWAHPLDIPSMVKKCVHMIAAHETRNSFPLDSCRRNNTYPPNTEEMVYPGVHSDVGGGYRPGEGARSLKPGQLLSLLPLRAMHRLAYFHGVPLYSLQEISYGETAHAFGTDIHSQKEFSKTVSLWQHYMEHINLTQMDLGHQINAHMRLYYEWRFYKIHQNRDARARRADTNDQAELKLLEQQWKHEKGDLQKQMNAAKKEADEAQSNFMRAQERLSAAKSDNRRLGISIKPSLISYADSAKDISDAAKDKYLRLKARHDTLPDSDGSLARNLDIYDDQLMADVKIIRSTLVNNPLLPIRPHYRNLLDAFEAEFVHNKGLRDPKLIEFFDTYVHDSLAAFAKDATLPSDPRVIYIGDDVKSQHASAIPDGPHTNNA
ncbi:DUF2235 domain-containing protein [Azohydromonas lata]|uniref:DUF2235 domain-containing protein n=1 Tax=Azohydromonas lata TaxID=45677 RepID=A0ABU5ICC0_9BURK|nr:DUF2235 domain-containing protein [Azohydromonas lata]MDZ5456592.1 DUF2235 domain-containing protein [Azohydromonas lata]